MNFMKSIKLIEIFPLKCMNVKAFIFHGEMTNHRHDYFSQFTAYQDEIHSNLLKKFLFSQLNSQNCRAELTLYINIFFSNIENVMRNFSGQQCYYNNLHDKQVEVKIRY